jgi:hypothetical protein
MTMDVHRFVFAAYLQHSVAFAVVRDRFDNGVLIEFYHTARDVARLRNGPMIFDPVLADDEVAALPVDIYLCADRLLHRKALIEDWVVRVVSA